MDAAGPVNLVMDNGFVLDERRSVSGVVLRMGTCTTMPRYVTTYVLIIISVTLTVFLSCLPLLAPLVTFITDIQNNADYRTELSGGIPSAQNA